jgi:hypothetical protein
MPTVYVAKVLRYYGILAFILLLCYIDIMIVCTDPSPLPPTPDMLVDGARVSQYPNSETFSVTIVTEPTLGHWVESNLDKLGKLQLGALGIFPELPDFTTRRQRLDYRRTLEGIWHQTEEANDAGFAAEGLAGVVRAIRAQREQLKPPKPPKSSKKTSLTPRHQR